jgi:hypothetical protein
MTADRVAVGQRDSTRAARRQRYGAVLVAIVVVFSIQGTAAPNKWVQMLVSVLLGFVLLLSLWEARARRGVMMMAVAVVVGVVLTSIVASASGNIDSAVTRLPDALVVALTPPAIVIGVMRDLRARREVTLQTVFGVLCVYILLGLFFANVYVSIDHLGGSPFFAEGQAANVANCIYYSFTTLTTVGYGDLTARTGLGHTLSVSEGLLGQIYLVTVVSLIVTNLGRRRPAVH